MFEKMTKSEALEYCYKNESKIEAEMYECGENGERQFECLVEILESKVIHPIDLPSYGTDYGA